MAVNDVPLVYLISASEDTTPAKPYVSVSKSSVLAMSGAVELAQVEVLAPTRGYEVVGEPTRFLDGEHTGAKGYHTTYSMRCKDFTTSSTEPNSITAFYNIQRSLLNKNIKYMWVDLGEIQEYLDRDGLWTLYHSPGHVIPVVLYGLQAEDKDNGNKGLIIELRHRWENAF